MRKKYEIVRKAALNPTTGDISVYAPRIAAKAKAGQFIILRVTEDGERIPLTVAGCADDCVRVIYQKVGRTTLELDELQEGDCLHDFVGPLGTPTEIEGVRRAVVVGGGLGCAITMPIAKALKEAGAEVDLIIGFRTKDLIILQDEMKAACTRLHICTDDGSYGYSGFGTGKLQELLDADPAYDRAYAVGPLPMMKAVTKTCSAHGVKTIVSMNPIMIDGTGMCGGCRVTVGGETKFACVDGPDFDGELVDFDEAMARNSTYRAFEAEQREAHVCRMGGMQ